MDVTNRITSPEFFEGGRAIFTVSNPKGEHYTFQIKHKKNTPFFVSLLTGPDNTSDFTYLGVYVPQKKTVVLTSKSKFKEDTTPVKVVRWAILKVSNKEITPNGYSIQHEGRCCRCGRMLTTPESIEHGIGPECMKKR
jgi:hypothetical protein